MKIIKVENEIYKDPNTAVHIDGKWENATPEAYEPNLIEKIRHNVLRQHFTFGQPYCVVCLKKELKL